MCWLARSSRKVTDTGTTMSTRRGNQSQVGSRFPKGGFYEDNFVVVHASVGD